MIRHLTFLTPPPSTLRPLAAILAADAVRARDLPLPAAAGGLLERAEPVAAPLPPARDGRLAAEALRALKDAAGRRTLAERAFDGRALEADLARGVPERALERAVTVFLAERDLRPADLAFTLDARLGLHTQGHARNNRREIARTTKLN